MNFVTCATSSGTCAASQAAVWLQKAILIAVIVRFGKRIRENVSRNVTQYNIFGMQLLKIQWN